MALRDIFNRALGAMNTVDIAIMQLFYYELASIPTSLFCDDGTLCPASAKSKLKDSLKTEKLVRTIPKPEVTFLDGCAVLWTISWCVSGIVQDLIDAMIGGQEGGSILKE